MPRMHGHATTSPDSNLSPLTGAERRRLRRCALAAGCACTGMLVLAGVTAWLWLAPQAALLLDHGRRWIFTALALVWLWLLRRQPMRLLHALGDLRDGRAREEAATSILAYRRGLGILAPVHVRMQIGGRLLDADGMAMDRLHPGHAVIVRSAPRSALVLDVRVQPGAPPPPSDGLTDRERELLLLLARGLSDKLIARELDLSPGTVRTYNSVLYRKLGARTRAGAIANARRRELLPVD